MATNISACGATGANTGLIKCGAVLGKAMQMAVCEHEFAGLDAVTAAALKAAFTAKSKLSKNDSSKLFLLPLHLDKESQRENNTDQTFTNGISFVAREGKPKWKFSFQTNLPQLKALRKLNNKETKIFVQNNYNQVLGTAGSVDGNGVMGLKGFRVNLFFEGMDFAADDKLDTIGMVTVTFIDERELYDAAYYFEAGATFESFITPLVDVEMYLVSTGSSQNIKNISLRVDVANLNNPLNMYATHSGVLTAANLTFTVQHTGLPIAVTGIVQNAAAKFAEVTFDSAAYTALSAGTKIVVTPASPTALDAANIVGIEVSPLIITK